MTFFLVYIVHLLSYLYEHCLHFVLTYLSVDNHFPFNIDLVNTPTSLTFISEHPTGSSCYSADYREDGDLLLGSQDGVRLLRREDMQMIRYDTNVSEVTSVVEHHRNVFILHGVKKTDTVEMTTQL